MEEPESSPPPQGKRDETISTSGGAVLSPTGETVPGETKERPGTTTFRPAVSEQVEEEQEVSFLSFLKLCLVFVILLFLVFFISQYLSYQKRRKRRRQRRKDMGDSRNQQR